MDPFFCIIIVLKLLRSVWAAPTVRLIFKKKLNFKGSIFHRFGITPETRPRETQKMPNCSARQIGRLGVKAVQYVAKTANLFKTSKPYWIYFFVMNLIGHKGPNFQLERKIWFNHSRHVGQSLHNDTTITRLRE